VLLRDVSQRTWGIICPGPSLGHQLHQDILRDSPDALIAVNGAILFIPAVNYWAMCDEEVFTYCIRQYADWNHNIVLWIPEIWERYISGTHPSCRHFNQFKKETFPGQSNEAFAEIMPFGKDIEWRERTLFTAIALAILKGAQQINIYGADLSGKGYYKPGLENCRTRHTEERWKQEQYWLGLIVKACAANGITVNRGPHAA
jgi:hypothetical protein